jgi:hypothetical protein
MQAEWLRVVWYLNFGGMLALISSLVWNGLYRVYLWLFAYLAMDAAQTSALLLLKTHRKLYSWTYVLSQPIKIVLAVFVILELYRVALAQRPALARFVRNMVGRVLAAAAVLALLFVMLDSSIRDGQSPVLHGINSFERTMDIGMLVFLILICVFMAWFPFRMTRNGMLYIAGFVVYFLSRVTGLLLTNLAPHLQERFDLAMLSVSLACLMTWLAALRHGGEEATVVTGARRDPARMRHLTQQLDAMNARLTEIARR